MDLKGIFSPNTIAMPQWKNKDGENEFNKMLDRLAEMGKKLTTLQKKADDSDGDASKTGDAPAPAPTPAMSGEYMNSSPRSLGEIFNTKDRLAQQAIVKARDIIGKQLAKLNLPSSDVYYLRSDITRFGGDGTPATGRISFQMPILTPQGDQRTIYADVDIVLGSLMPPRQFFDGINQRFAFTGEGVGEFLSGRNFDIMTNPKIKPETTFFETPGHLAGKGGFAILKKASVKKADDDSTTRTDKFEYAPEPGKEPASGVESVPAGGEEGAYELHPEHKTAKAIDEFENILSNIVMQEKETKEAKKILDDRMKSTKEYGEYGKSKGILNESLKRKKEVLSLIEEFLSTMKGQAIINNGRLYKYIERQEEARTPLYKILIGKILAIVPSLKGAIDKLWLEIRSTVKVKLLERSSPVDEKTEEFEIRRDEPKDPEGPRYDPPESEAEKITREKKEKKIRLKKEMKDQMDLDTASQKGSLVKIASLMDGMEELYAGMMEIDALLEEVGA